MSDADKPFTPEEIAGLAAAQEKIEEGVRDTVAVLRSAGLEAFGIVVGRESSQVEGALTPIMWSVSLPTALSVVDHLGDSWVMAPVDGEDTGAIKRAYLKQLGISTDDMPDTLFQ